MVTLMWPNSGAATGIFAASFNTDLLYNPSSHGLAPARLLAPTTTAAGFLAVVDYAALMLTHWSYSPPLTETPPIFLPVNIALLVLLLSTTTVFYLTDLSARHIGVGLTRPRLIVEYVDCCILVCTGSSRRTWLHRTDLNVGVSTLVSCFMSQSGGLDDTSASVSCDVCPPHFTLMHCSW